MKSILLKILFVKFFLISFLGSAQEEVITASQETFYIQEFKRVYFKRCLKYAYNNNEAINSVLKEDRSTSGDFVLGLYRYRLIDSLAQRTAILIKKDSVLHPWKQTEDSAGKRVFKYCLDTYSGTWLDSIAGSKLKP